MRCEDCKHCAWENIGDSSHPCWLYECGLGIAMEEDCEEYSTRVDVDPVQERYDWEERYFDRYEDRYDD